MVEARNTADNAIYSAERALREAGEKVAGPTRTSVEAKIQAVRQKLDSEDVAALRQVTNDLLQAMQGIGAAMYEGTGSVGGGTGGSAGGGGTGETGPTPNKPDDVVDGEFKEA
jgi:molecular chaperone DnaK